MRAQSKGREGRGSGTHGVLGQAVARARVALEAADPAVGGDARARDRVRLDALAQAAEARAGARARRARGCQGRAGRDGRLGRRGGRQGPGGRDARERQGRRRRQGRLDGRKRRLVRLGPGQALAAGDDDKVGLPRLVAARRERARAVLVDPPAVGRLERQLRLLVRQRRPRLDQRVGRREEQVDVDRVVRRDEAREVGVPDELAPAGREGRRWLDRQGRAQQRRRWTVSGGAGEQGGVCGSISAQQEAQRRVDQTCTRGRAGTPWGGRTRSGRRSC